MLDIRPVIRRAPAFALLALLSTSCGRLPTSPASGARTTHPASAVATRGSDAIAGEVVVTLAAGADANAVAADHQATLVGDLSDCGEATFVPAGGQTAADLQAALALDPRVITAEPDGWLETAETRQQSFAFDDGLGSLTATIAQPAAEAIHLDEAHAIATGDGVLVAILDTGIDPQHPMLKDALVPGRDFVDGDMDPTDVADGIDNDGDGLIDEGFGHGTHVAGIVRLVAPGARILPVRVLDSDGRGDILQIAAGVRWAVDQGAKVINLSLGSLRSSDALQHALEDAENRGVIVISSAGNWGADTPVEFPAKSSHVAAIAAVDAASEPAPFSSFGSIIALAAPGVAVRSAFPGGGYRLWSGTSMSAPFVAGTAALLAQVHPDWTLDLTIERIGATAGPVLANASQFGDGALNAGAALAPDAGWSPGEPGVVETFRQARRR